MFVGISLSRSIPVGRIGGEIGSNILDALELMIRNAWLQRCHSTGPSNKRAARELFRAALLHCDLARDANLSLRKQRLRPIHQLSKAVATFGGGNLAAIKLKHVEPERRRKIALLTLRIDTLNEIRQRHKPPAGNLLESIPERVLQAHASLMATKNDRALYDWRFHNTHPPDL
jgi:hypothetical protein